MVAGLKARWSRSGALLSERAQASRDALIHPFDERHGILHGGFGHREVVQGSRPVRKRLEGGESHCLEQRVILVVRLHLAYAVGDEGEEEPLAAGLLERILEPQAVAAEHRSQTQWAECFQPPINQLTNSESRVTRAVLRTRRHP